MKRIIIFLMAFSSTILVSAQSVLSFGVRGGSDLLIPKSEQTIKPKMGLAGNFDIGYTYYWKTRGSGECGIHTGASVGYANNMCQITFSQQYTNYDYMSNEMLYTAISRAKKRCILVTDDESSIDFMINHSDAKETRNTLFKNRLIKNA